MKQKKQHHPIFPHEPLGGGTSKSSSAQARYLKPWIGPGCNKNKNLKPPALSAFKDEQGYCQPREVGKLHDPGEDVFVDLLCLAEGCDNHPHIQSIFQLMSKSLGGPGRPVSAVPPLQHNPGS